MEQKIKEVEHKIQSLCSDIDKNQGELNDLASHKEFLFKIFENKDKEWATTQRETKNRKIKEIKYRWVKDRKDGLDF